MNGEEWGRTGCPSTACPHLHPPKAVGQSRVLCQCPLDTVSQPSRSDSQDATATLPSASTESPRAQASDPAPKEGTGHIVPPPAVSPGHRWEAACPQPPRPWHTQDSQLPPQALPLLPQQSKHPSLQHSQGVPSLLLCSLPSSAQPQHPCEQGLPIPAPHLPPSAAARSSNGAAGPAPERMGKVMAIDPGQGTELLPKGLGAEQPQPGRAETRAASQQGWECHCHHPCQSKGRSARPGLAHGPAEGTTVCPQATEPAQVWELGTRGLEEAAVSTSPLIAPAP